MNYTLREFFMLKMTRSGFLNSRALYGNYSKYLPLIKCYDRELEKYHSEYRACIICHWRKRAVKAG